MISMTAPRPAPPAALAGLGAAAAGRPRPALTAARRRRRLLAVASTATVALAIAAVAGLTGGGHPAAGGSSPSPAKVHVVAPGDTVFTIAAAHAPERDVRLVVDELVELNGRAAIVPGQRIILPPPR